MREFRNGHLGPILSATALVLGVLLLTAGLSPASAASLSGAKRLSDLTTPRVEPRSAPLPGEAAIVPGFGSHSLSRNDDGSTLIQLPFPLDYFGKTYTSLYINNNGNLTMGEPDGQYTPESLSQVTVPMIAPFWANVDTRVGPVVTYGYDMVNNNYAFGVNWLGVGCYNQIESVADYFQVLLISRPDQGVGDFDIEFNYGPINWDSGQASGGNGQCRDGTPARAGYTNGHG